MKYRLGDLTVKHWNDWDRVPRDPVSIFAFATTTLGLGTAGALLFTAVATIGISVATSWAISALMPQPDFSSFGSQGTLVNERNATSPADFVYGEVRKGGTVVFYESTGEENKYLHQVIALAGHEVNAIGDIYINDEVVPWNASTGFVTTGSWEDDEGNPKIRIRKHLGDQTTADADLANETSAGSTFVGNGIAYLYVRYEYDQDVFANGLPLVTAKIQGKKVYDPRTDTTAYSNNAALCMRDFIASEYGLNDSAIDDVSFSVAANESDENVALSGSGTEKRYAINGIVKSSSPIGKVLGDMSTACAGTLFWGSGYWKLKVGAYSSPVKTLTLDDLRGPISMKTRTSMRDSFNGVSGTFNDAEQDFITADYPPIQSDIFKAEDGGDELMLDLPLPFTTSASAAQRLAKLTLYRAREQISISADFGLNAFDIEVGDIIAFDNERYGFDGKEFEVMGWRFESNQDAGDLRVNLALQETSAAAFDWNAEETAIIANNTTLPVYTAGMSILGLSVNEGGLTQSDGTRISTAIVDWSDVTNAYLERYEVQWKPTADTSYSSTFTSESAIELSPIIDGVEYTFRVRAVSANGYRGPFASVTFTGGGDVVPPAVPTNLSAAGGYKYITVSFDTPTDYDFSQVEVYENTTSDLGSASSIGKTSGNEFIRANLSNNATRFYWVRSVDLSGNPSAFVGPVSATTALIEGADLTASLLETIEQAGVTPVNSLPASGDFEGQIVFLLTNNRLYRWTGSAWSSELYAGIENGSVTETKIASGSISTPKLQTNSVTANQISAGAVVTDKIAANAIVASKIAAGQVTADKLNVSELSAITANLGTIQVDTANIANGAITNAKIENLDAVKITTGELDVRRIVNGDITNTVSAITSGTTGALSTSFSDIQEVTMTTRGGKIVVMCSCNLNTYLYAAFRILKNGVEVATIDACAGWAGTSVLLPNTVMIPYQGVADGSYESPATTVFKFQAKRISGAFSTYSGIQYVSQRQIVATEYRR